MPRVFGVSAVVTLDIKELRLQEGDPYPEWPEDADTPMDEPEQQYRLQAAGAIRGKGNAYFKQASGGCHHTSTFSGPDMNSRSQCLGEKPFNCILLLSAAADLLQVVSTSCYATCRVNIRRR